MLPGWRGSEFVRMCKTWAFSRFKKSLHWCCMSSWEKRCGTPLQKPEMMLLHIYFQYSISLPIVCSFSCLVSIFVIPRIFFMPIPVLVLARLFLGSHHAPVFDLTVWLSRLVMSNFEFPADSSNASLCFVYLSESYKSESELSSALLSGTPSLPLTP